MTFGDRQAPAPHLQERRATGPVLGAVLVLHGGRERGHGPVRPWSLPFLRAELLARSVHRRVAPHGVGVWSLRFAVSGWNDAEQSPVADARWALEEIGRRAAVPAVPVVIVGHSMGGRTALRVAAEPAVAGLVLLAPWLPPDEPMAQLAGRDLVIAHGTADRVTRPGASRQYAERARATAARVEHIDVRGEGHSLLRHPGIWNDIVVDAALEQFERIAPSRPRADVEESSP